MAYLRFRKIDLEQDLETVLAFRLDVFRISFTSNQEFNVQKYIQHLEAGIRDEPEGFMLAEVNGVPVGQLEMRITGFEGRTIAYVHLFYLRSENRGKGYGKELLNYAEEFCQKHGIGECHLRVSVRNVPAIGFYERHGFQKVRKESSRFEVWRMRKLVQMQ